MNFIGVLAMIAGFGFAVSAVEFIRMGVSSAAPFSRRLSWI
jgi:cation-transporting ATPase 13A3/4/5